MSRQGSLIKLIILLIVVGLVVGYAIFNSRFLRSGPEIEIYDLVDGQITEENIINIRGKAKNISFISLNGRQIFINENSEFNEKLLLTNKINPIEIYAKDKFNKEIRKNITLVYKGEKINLPETEEIEIMEEIATTTASSTEEKTE